MVLIIQFVFLPHVEVIILADFYFRLVLTLLTLEIRQDFYFFGGDVASAELSVSAGLHVRSEALPSSEI